MEHIVVNQERCIRCGACMAECPTAVITADSEGIPKPISAFRDYCLKCAHCVTVCPTDALSLDWLAPEQCPPIEDDRKLSPEQAEQFLRARRSIRNFKPKTVERATMEKMLEVASHAPSAKNKQPWNWVVVEGPAVRECAGMVIEWMRSLLVSNRKAAEASGMHLVVASWDAGVERVCRGAQHVVVAYGDKSWPFGVEDCTLAFSHLDLYATSLGLGACWGGYFYNASNSYPPLFAELGIPQGNKVFGAMMVGYPVYEYHRMPVRNKTKIDWK